MAEEVTPSASQGPEAFDPVDQPPDGQRPPREVREKPRADADRMVEWERPDARTLALETRAATPILQAFLARNASLFGVEADAVAGTLGLVQYQPGAYFRTAGAPVTDPPFLDLVPLRFAVVAGGGHYNVPLLVSPYGYVTYRGS